MSQKTEEKDLFRPPWKLIILPSLSVCSVSPLQYSNKTADLLFSTLAYLYDLYVADSVCFFLKDI